MEAEENKISVWVCREEKLVSGLSKRTSCADVMRLLLGEQNLEQRVSLSGSPQSYCIVEKWRGFERILPNKTKILRLWSAWGEEQENVRFVLVKNEASLPSNGPRSAEARVVLSKESPCVYKGTARVTMALSQEKQRRIVRKAFRKLDKINKKRAQAAPKDASSMERMETLVHLVVSQDHTIRQQIHRIKELDREIERYEAKVHFDRMKMHGINYVQDTYLVDTNPDKVEKDDGPSAVDVSSDNELLLEEERIRTQLDTSLYIGLRLNTDLEAIRNDLDLTQEIWGAKEKELRDLMEKVNSVDFEEDGEADAELKEENTIETDRLMPLQGDSVWVEQARGLSKTCDVNDDDSDTGLSSMHSQDSDITPICQSLV
uniref:Ras association domain family member 10 n=1 Tax=Cyprinus carpio TaxID=7962 RepID=A0A8C2H9C2_CYPCA